MNVRISHTASAQQFLEEASGQFTEGGNPRAKAIIYRILRDSVNIIEDLEICLFYTFPSPREGLLFRLRLSA